MVQVTEHVHSVRIPFQLEVGPGRILERVVYAYLIDGDQICLVDCGVASSEELILDEARTAERAPEQIGMAVITHAHPDHIGGAMGIQASTGCQIAAHVDAVPWIEDTDRQYRERPVPGFHSIVEGSVKVDVMLRDGDSIPLGSGGTLEVIHTPGHSRGHIALLYSEDKALFAGDAIPLPGAMPIYNDVSASIASLKKLRAIEGLEVLFSAWDESRHGHQIYAILDEGMAYLQDVHKIVQREQHNHPSADLRSLTARVLDSLGLPEVALSPLTMTSIEAHLQLAHRQDVREL